MFSQQLGLALCMGLLAHNVVFIRGEWHLHIPHIVICHLSLLLGTAWLIYRGDGGVSLGYSAQKATVLAVAYLAALFTSMTTYRLFFHRLSKFPGPKLAAVSKFWHVYQVRYSTNHLLMTALHKKYGNIIRTGPNEITILHPSSIHLLDAWGNSTTKDVWYDILVPKMSVVFTRSEQHHKDTLKPWKQAFSGIAMKSFNQRVLGHVQNLCDCLESYNNEAAPVNDTISRFTFDVIGDVLFSKNHNLLGTKGWHPFLNHRRDALCLLGPINDTTWLGHMMFFLAPFWRNVKDWFYMVDYSVDEMEERFNDTERKSNIDIASYFIDEFHRLEGVFDLQKRKYHLQGSAVTAVFAGNDTTRSALIVAIWALANYPEHAAKILQEVQTVDASDPAALGALPHLEGFIAETLRMLPPAMSGAARVTGPRGLLVDGTLIPPGVKITAPKYVMMRLDTAFVHPNEFIPERWYSRPELVLDRRAFAPFSLGPRACVGKPLAYSELRLMVANLVKRFEVKFAPDYDAMTLWNGLRDQVTAQPGDVRCIFSLRK